MIFNWKKERRPYICLAPMAGYTDSAFRQIIKEIAPNSILFSEMVSSDGLKYNSRTNQNLIKFKRLEKPLIVQLFGKVPENFAIAAKIVEEMGADGIDINMGCPAHKVVKSNHGAALIKNPKLAQEIIQATVEASNLPVSVKTRLGWENEESLIDFGKMIEKSGAKVVTIHGRTYKQGFSGSANWKPIYELKKELKISVIGNGDICSIEDAKEKLKNLDGFMVGRATFGNPWLMQELDDYFYGKEKTRRTSVSMSEAKTDTEGGNSQSSFIKLTLVKKDFIQKGRGNLKVQVRDIELPKDQKQTVTPNSQENDTVTHWFKYKKPVILKHCKYAIKMKGERIAMNEMRKHLAMYVKGLPNAKELRRKLVLVNNQEEVKNILSF